MHKEMGLVAQVFDEPSLTALRGDIAVAHCRYSTTGAPVWANAQPTFRSTNRSLALGHNGNLTNTRELTAMLAAENGFAGLQATSDTDVLTELIADGADPAESRRPRPASCRRFAAPIRWSSWMRTRCTRPGTRRDSGRSSSGGSPAAG